MTVSVALNALMGVLLSLLYIVTVGYVWRFRRHWLIVIPILNAIFYLVPTALYIRRAVRGDLTLRPLNWGVLLLLLPAIQVAMFLYWSTRDAARGRAIAVQAQTYTDEANTRAGERAVVEAAEVAERTELAAERTANATERLADAADGLVPPKQGE